MKLFTNNHFVEVASFDDEPKGAYICWTLSPKSAQSIESWARLVGISNPVPAHEMHATVMYSPENGVPVQEHRDIPLQMPVTVGYYNLPRTQILGKPGSAGALVTVFDSAALRERHFYWRERGLRSNFDTYIPHVTLSYDASSVPQEVVARLLCNPCPLPHEFDTERVSYCN